MDPKDQPIPAEPVTPAEPAPAEPTAPVALAEGQPAEEPAPGANEAPVEGAPAPQQSRQERRDQERAARGINGLSQPVTQNQQFNQPAPSYPNSPQGFDVRQFADVEGNLDVDRTNAAFQQNVVQTADAIASARVSQQLDQRDAVHNFERDQDSVSKFPELDPAQPNSYSPELDEAIAAEFQERAFKIVGYTPTGQPITQLDKSVRLSDIAKRQVNAVRAAAARLNSNTNSAVDAAADSAAPRPTGAKPSEKKFEDLSLAEMKQRIGYHKG